MTTKRIGCDLDGVMYEWERTARYMLSNILPHSPYPKDGPLGQVSQSWDHIQNNVSKEHWNWLWDEGVKLGLFRHGHLFPGTIKAVRQLAELGDVIVCTARPKQAVPDTVAWLAYQQLPIHGIHILSKEPKSSIPGCDIWIDDKPANCIDLLATGAVVCLQNRPWNKDFDDPRIIRVYNWDEFVWLARQAPRVKRP